MERKTINRALGLIVPIVCIAAARLVIFNYYHKSAPSFETQLRQVANKENKTCPKMTDSGTRCDSVIALPNNTIQYNFTFINLTKDSIDTIEWINDLEQKLINDLCTDTLLKKNSVTEVFAYNDMNSSLIHKFIISPENCK